MQGATQNNIKLFAFRSHRLNIHDGTTKIICTMRLETLNIQDLDFTGQLIFWRVSWGKKEAIEGETKKRERLCFEEPLFPCFAFDALPREVCYFELACSFVFPACHIQSNRAPNRTGGLPCSLGT